MNAKVSHTSNYNLYCFIDTFTNFSLNHLTKLGYGFVNFESPYSAEQAVIDLQNKGYQVQMSRENRVPRQPILAGAPSWQ